MFLKGSRYEGSRPFTLDPRTGAGFEGVRPRAIAPAQGVVEHVVAADERLDLLARHYYDDERLWWRIVDANPGFLFGPDLLLGGMEGRVILVPRREE